MGQISKMANRLVSSNLVIEAQLKEQLSEVEAILDADLVAYMGPIGGNIVPILKEIVESIDPRRKRLAVLLETNGGFIEVAERMGNLFRHHYRTVDFLVPTFAMSAGTVLVMSGDAIYMDYASTLGPIDPQLARPDSQDYVPALGYLEHYDRLIAKSANGTLTTAELAFLIENFDPAELYRYEQERDLSTALLEEWLVKYKFKNWKTTETQGEKVTIKMRRERAKQIGNKLNDTSRWHSHARGITMEVLRKELKLQIEDLDDDPELSKSVSAYERLLSDYRGRMGHWMWITHWKGAYDGHGH